MLVTLILAGTCFFTSVRADEFLPLGQLFAGRPSSSRSQLSMEGTWIDRQPVEQSEYFLLKDRQALRAEYSPPSEEGRKSSFFIKGLREAPHTQARFADSGKQLPLSLEQMYFGYHWTNRRNPQKIWGASASVGSSSDRLFYSVQELSGSAMGFLMMPGYREMDSWLFLLHYSTDRTFLPHLPLPGVSYLFRRSEKWMLLLGLPTIFTWRPSKSWMLTTSWILGGGVNAELNYVFGGPVRAFLGTKYRKENYRRANRGDKLDRIFSFERSAYMGFVLPVIAGVLGELSAHYYWDNYYFEGRHRNRKNEPKISGENALGVSAKLQVSF